MKAFIFIVISTIILSSCGQSTPPLVCTITAVTKDSVVTTMQHKFADHKEMIKFAADAQAQMQSLSITNGEELLYDMERK